MHSTSWSIQKQAIFGNGVVRGSQENKEHRENKEYKKCVKYLLYIEAVYMYDDTITS